MFEIVEYSDKYHKAWDDYVQKSKSSTIYHTIGWRNALEMTYKIKTIYLMALDQKNNPVGILPIVYQKFPFLANALVSLPCSNYGGIIADSVIIAEALLEKATNLLSMLKAKYLLLKQLNKVDDISTMNDEKYFSLIVELENNFENVWKSRFTKSCRNHCKKAIKLGVKVELGNNDKYLEEFYAMYSKKQHQFGTPTHHIKWFSNFSSLLKENVLFAIAYYKDKPAAGVCAFLFKDRIISNYSARNDELNISDANNLVRSELIKYGCENGYKWFDFARSKKGSGTYQFKESFGAKPVLTSYQYVLNKIRKMPDLDPENPKFSLAINIWRKLPTSFVQALGPFIRKNMST